MFCYRKEYNLGIRKINEDDIVEIDSIDELIEIDSNYVEVKHGKN